MLRRQTQGIIPRAIGSVTKGDRASRGRKQGTANTSCSRSSVAGIRNTLHAFKMNQCRGSDLQLTVDRPVLFPTYGEESVATRRGARSCRDPDHSSSIYTATKSSGVMGDVTWGS